MIEAIKEKKVRAENLPNGQIGKLLDRVGLTESNVTVQMYKSCVHMTTTIIITTAIYMRLSVSVFTYNLLRVLQATDTANPLAGMHNC